MIRKRGKVYEVVARTGRIMGRYTSKEAAKKRLRQIEYFKANPGKSHKGKRFPL
jgi:hypothetical protein